MGAHVIEGLAPEEPLRAVRHFKVVPHPSGRFVLIVTYTCGHSIWWWRRREPRKPPRAKRCTSCWLNAADPTPPAQRLLAHCRAMVEPLRASGACEARLLDDLDRALVALGV